MGAALSISTTISGPMRSSNRISLQHIRQSIHTGTAMMDTSMQRYPSTATTAIRCTAARQYQRYPSTATRTRPYCNAWSSSFGVRDRRHHPEHYSCDRMHSFGSMPPIGGELFWPPNATFRPRPGHGIISVLVSLGYSLLRYFFSFHKSGG